MDILRKNPKGFPMGIAPEGFHKKMRQAKFFEEGAKKRKSILSSKNKGAIEATKKKGKVFKRFSPLGKPSMAQKARRAAQDFQPGRGVVEAYLKRR